MRTYTLDPQALRDDFFRQFARYWPLGMDALRALALPRTPLPEQEVFPPRLAWVQLPDWAHDLGADGQHAGKLPIPAHLVPLSAKWRAVDWPLCGAWFMHCLAERAHEQQYGPVHSYSFRLKGWPTAMWSRAWTNRIALFLRRLAATEYEKDERSLFGQLPEAEITLTHDVDAMRKTVPIRCKQAVFNLFNAARALASRRGTKAWRYAKSAFNFILRRDENWHFSRIARLDEEYGQRSLFFFPGREPALFLKSPRAWLFDPGYDALALKTDLTALTAAGHAIGLHPTFDACADAGKLVYAKERLQEAVCMPVKACRQHWLRFSFAATWAAQATAGLTSDYTLGFNDRVGFRNAAAIRHEPLGPDGKPIPGFFSIPLVLMDSQLYNYTDSGYGNTSERIKLLLDELCFTRGQASILWHPHTIFVDYGWEEGYLALLRELELTGLPITKCAEISMFINGKTDMPKR